MKRILLFVGFVGFVGFVALISLPCDARIFGRRRGNVNNINITGVTFTGGAQAVCEQKAALQARLGRMFHPGGSFGGGNYEGVAMASDPTNALNNCYYYGQRQCIGAAVCRGSNGMYYACRIYR